MLEALGRSIDGGHTFLVLVLLLGDSLLSFQESFSVLIKLELNNGNVGGVDGDLSLATYDKSLEKMKFLPLVFSLVIFSMWRHHFFL